MSQSETPAISNSLESIHANLGTMAPAFTEEGFDPHKMVSAEVADHIINKLADLTVPDSTQVEAVGRVDGNGGVSYDGTTLQINPDGDASEFNSSEDLSIPDADANLAKLTERWVEAGGLSTFDTDKDTAGLQLEVTPPSTNVRRILGVADAGSVTADFSNLTQRQQELLFLEHLGVLKAGLTGAEASGTGKVLTFLKFDDNTAELASDKAFLVALAAPDASVDGQTILLQKGVAVDGTTPKMFSTALMQDLSDDLTDRKALVDEWHVANTPIYPEGTLTAHDIAKITAISATKSPHDTITKLTPLTEDVDRSDLFGLGSDGLPVASADSVARVAPGEDVDAGTKAIGYHSRVDATLAHTVESNFKQDELDALANRWYDSEYSEKVNFQGMNDAEIQAEVNKMFLAQFDYDIQIDPTSDLRAPTNLEELHRFVAVGAAPQDLTDAFIFMNAGTANNPHLTSDKEVPLLVADGTEVRTTMLVRKSGGGLVDTTTKPVEQDLLPPFGRAPDGVSFKDPTLTYPSGTESITAQLSAVKTLAGDTALADLYNLNPTPAEVKLIENGRLDFSAHDAQVMEVRALREALADGNYEVDPDERTIEVNGKTYEIDSLTLNAFFQKQLLTGSGIDPLVVDLELNSQNPYFSDLIEMDGTALITSSEHNNAVNNNTESLRTSLTTFDPTSESYDQLKQVITKEDLADLLSPESPINSPMMTRNAGEDSTSIVLNGESYTLNIVQGGDTKTYNITYDEIIAGFAKGDYKLSPEAAELVVQTSDFPISEIKADGSYGLEDGFLPIPGLTTDPATFDRFMAANPALATMNAAGELEQANLRQFVKIGKGMQEDIGLFDKILKGFEEEPELVAAVAVMSVLAAGIMAFTGSKITKAVRGKGKEHEEGEDKASEQESLEIKPTSGFNRFIPSMPSISFKSKTTDSSPTAPTANGPAKPTEGQAVGS